VQAHPKGPNRATAAADLSGLPDLIPGFRA
jgi:hypothetical protein